MSQLLRVREGRAGRRKGAGVEKEKKKFENAKGRWPSAERQALKRKKKFKG